MKPVALAWRGLVRQPARAALGIAGIAAVGALLFDMLLLSRGLVISFQDLLDSAGFDARVTATRAMPTAGPPMDSASELIAAIESLPEIEQVVPMIFGSAHVRGEPPFYFIGSGARPRRTWRVVEGEPLPVEAPRDGPASLVINRNLAAHLELAPGDTVRLYAAGSEARALPGMEFLVTGIVEIVFDSSEAMTAATHREAYYRLYGEPDRDDVDLLLVASRGDVGANDAVAAIEAAFPEYHAYSNEQFVARLRGTDFSYFRQISFVLTTVTLFFAFLLVATLLTVSVNQRFAEIAALRALGFARRRIVADLLWESALVVGAGGLLGLPIGALLAYWLDAILRDIPGLPARLHFFVFEPRAVALYVALLALTGMLAALYPVFLATRLPIAATLRKETVS
jgi:putative ABC transport system permease protein